MDAPDFVHPVDILLEEHRKISRYIVNFSNLLDNPAEWESAIQNAIQLINHDFVQHERREAILVNELEKLMGGKIGPLEMVEKEHRQLDSLRKRFNQTLGKIDLSALDGTDPNVLELLDIGNRLVWAKKSHFFKDEHFLFAAARGVLPAERLREIAWKMEAI
ncbi:MAG: hemerythrin domain-containing protein [Nitrospirae bacterium]|nr:hemerythrin domain-containing protein [Nitrospirota bacterium]